MNRLSLLIFFSILISAPAAEIALRWDPSPTPGVTNYLLEASTGTNSFRFNTGTNLNAVATPLVAGVWRFRAYAQLDGVLSDPSNEVVKEVPAPPPNLRTLVLETFVDLASTNHTGQAFIKVRFIP